MNKARNGRSRSRSRDGTRTSKNSAEQRTLLDSVSVELDELRPTVHATKNELTPMLNSIQNRLQMGDTFSIRPNLRREQPPMIENGRSSIMSAVSNFVNSIVGAGIIGLPFALSQSGFWMGIIMMVALALLVDWTVRLLIRSGKLASRSSYQDLVEFCFGSRGLAYVSVFQFIFAFGAMCAYLVIVGDTMPIVLRQMVGNGSELVLFLTSRRFVIFITTLFISFPLSLYRDISKLANTSALALFALIFILVAVIVEGPQQPAELRDSPPLDFIRDGFLQAIGVISFAFVCHHNSFLIYGSLREPSLDRWSLVTHLSTGISCILSLSLAVPGYLLFGEKTRGNILNNFSHDNTVMNIARTCFALNMFTTFPLECFVCREVIENYYFPGKPISTRLNIILTTLLTAASLMIALSTCDLGFVLELTGCFSATVLAYILPAACYLKLSSGSIISLKKLWPLVSMIFGIIVMVISTVLTVTSAFESEKVSKQCYW